MDSTYSFVRNGLKGLSEQRMCLYSSWRNHLKLLRNQLLDGRVQVIIQIITVWKVSRFQKNQAHIFFCLTVENRTNVLFTRVSSIYLLSLPMLAVNNKTLTANNLLSIWDISISHNFSVLSTTIEYKKVIYFKALINKKQFRTFSISFLVTAGCCCYFMLLKLLHFASFNIPVCKLRFPGC